MSDVQNANAQMLTWEAGRGTTWIMEISKYQCTTHDPPSGVIMTSCKQWIYVHKKLWYLNYSTLFIEESDPQSDVDQFFQCQKLTVSQLNLIFGDISS